MLRDFFNPEAISKMSLKEFTELYEGNQNLSRMKIDIKKAFKELGGKITKAKKFKKSED